jgi:hypothetical protein
MSFNDCLADYTLFPHVRAKRQKKNPRLAGEKIPESINRSDKKIMTRLRIFVFGFFLVFETVD